MVEQEAGRSRASRPPIPPPRSSRIPDDQFQDIRIKKLTGADTIDLKRDNGKWKHDAAEAAGRRPGCGRRASFRRSRALNADKVVEDKATDLKPYGLDNPALDVTITKKDGKTAELLIGDDTPTGSGTYAKLAERPARVHGRQLVKTEPRQERRTTCATSAC